MITCKFCLELKLEHEFYASNLSCCKTCHRKRVKANREANIGYYREYDRKRGSRLTASYLKAYRKNNAKKYKAHNAVNNAVRDGRLNKAPCVICGEDKAHGHHDNYNKPLDVVWLCAAHHKERHASLDTLLA